MTITHRSRYIYWLLKDLFIKYTHSLIFGFIIGFIVSILVIRLWPTIDNLFFVKTNYIGVIGDYTPSTLPLFIQQQVSFGLTSMDQEGIIHPDLSDHWETTDSGKTYLFHIRPDIYWHNGNKVSAYDINYNIRQVKFSVLDISTLKAELESTYSPFPSLVSKPIFLKGLIGVGKMKVTKIKLKGDSIEQLRLVNTNPQEKKIQIEYRFYTTEAQAIIAYKLGQIDEIYDLSSVYGFKNWNNSQITEHTKENRIITIFFNMTNQFLSEKKHRQALGYALPEPKFEKAVSPISNTSWAYYDKVKKYKPDPAQVKKLLGSDFVATDSNSLTITTLPGYLDDAQVIAASWSAIGVKTSVKVENSVPSDYQILITGLDIPPDPDQYTFWHSTQSTNVTKYNNPKIDLLLEQGRKELDEKKRKQIYFDFQRYLVDDSPALFLYYPKEYTITRK